MKQHKKFAVGALCAAVLFGACSDDFEGISGLAPVREFFVAALAGANERPTPVTTTASGSSNITVLDTNLIRVETFVSTIDSVTQAHIHAGDATVAGPVMVFLVGPFTATQLVARGFQNTTTLNGVLSHVDITRTSTFSAPFNFDSLMFRVNNGTAYVNVHTRRNPGGEIRGQIDVAP